MRVAVKNRIISSFLMLVLGFLLIVPNAFATDSKTIFDVLNHTEVLKVNMELDLSAILENRRNDDSYPATLRFVDEQGNPQDWSLNIHLRGNFRRIHCAEMPPLKLDFSKKDLEKAGLAPFDDLKLVNYCMGDDREDKEALVKEYLTYKLYNQLTEASYRVQMLKINFKDINTGQTRTQFAFLIEDTAQLKARIAAQKLDEFRVIEKERFDPFHLKASTLFQYMIGNKDWGVTFSKNVKYLSKEEKVIPVPYDFDFATIVGASYTKTKKDAKALIDKRIYLGFYEEMESLRPIIDQFVNKRESMNEIILNCTFLRTGAKKEMIAYLDLFFENTENIKFAEHEI